jgi:starch synthase
MASRKLKILFVSVEVAPLAKVGGLADVAGALPKALKALGHDVRIIMPSYRMIEDNPENAVEECVPEFSVPIHEGLSLPATLKKTAIGDIPVYLVASDRYFTEATESKKIYSLEAEPYIFFDRAVAEAIPRLTPNWTPDVIHCHDWQTGLIAVYLDTFYHDHPVWESVARVFTVHNLAYQGDYPYEIFRYAGLPEELFTWDRLEFYGRMNFMKGGLIYSDVSNTVSPTYARETQTEALGCGLHGLLQYLAAQKRYTGILNGIDMDVYNPQTDPNLAASYSAENPAGKAKCKTALQAECGLPKSKKSAVIGIVSRLADQKGFDLIREAADDLLRLPVQLVLLGTGDPAYEAYFQELQKRYPKKVRAFLGYDAQLAQRIYSGSDIFLMPSRYEPCGLGQLMSLRYGTIPVVRATGGLADTISDYSARSGKGNGFVFEEYDAAAMLEAVRRAVETFQDGDAWKRLVERALNSDFSWNSSAKKYVELYRQALAKLRLVAAA